MKLIGQLIVVFLGVGALRMSGTDSLPWWLDLSLTVGGVLLIRWYALSERRDA